MIWRRARTGERCGYCDDHTFTGGEPMMLIGGLKRCAAVAKARYGEEVPVPFPEEVAPAATMARAAAAFADVRSVRQSKQVRTVLADVKARQSGERE